jgi:hypothetical protein
MAMTLVSTITVGSGGATHIDFTNIPQTGKDLLLLSSIRGDAGNQYVVRFNGDTVGSTYRQFYGIGNGVFNDNGTNGPVQFLNDSTTTSNTFANTSLYIANYTSSANKPMSADGVTENNATTAYQVVEAGTWLNSAAITSIRFQNVSALQHSTVSLYIIS